MATLPTYMLGATRHVVHPEFVVAGRAGAPPSLPLRDKQRLSEHGPHPMAN
jgi:hypothetical protein